MKKIGTIYDKSYFDVWKEDSKVYKMCMDCDKPVLMRDLYGLTGGRHYCNESNKWINFVSLERDGFTYIPEKENNEHTK